MRTVVGNSGANEAKAQGITEEGERSETELLDCELTLDELFGLTQDPPEDINLEGLDLNDCFMT